MNINEINKAKEGAKVKDVIYSDYPERVIIIYDNGVRVEILPTRIGTLFSDVLYPMDKGE